MCNINHSTRVVVTTSFENALARSTHARRPGPRSGHGLAKTLRSSRRGRTVLFGARRAPLTPRCVRVYTCCAAVPRRRRHGTAARATGTCTLTRRTRVTVVVVVITYTTVLGVVYC